MDENENDDIQEYSAIADNVFRQHTTMNTIMPGWLLLGWFGLGTAGESPAMVACDCHCRWGLWTRTGQGSVQLGLLVRRP